MCRWGKEKAALQHLLLEGVRGEQRDWVAWSIPGAPISSCLSPQPAPRGGGEFVEPAGSSLLLPAFPRVSYLSFAPSAPRWGQLAINHFCSFFLKNKEIPAGCSPCSEQPSFAQQLPAANSCAEAIWRGRCGTPAAGGLHAHSTHPCLPAQHGAGNKAPPKPQGCLPRAIVQQTELPEDEASQKCQEAFGKAKAVKTAGDLQGSAPGGI